MKELFGLMVYLNRKRSNDPDTSCVYIMGHGQYRCNQLLVLFFFAHCLDQVRLVPGVQGSQITCVLKALTLQECQIQRAHKVLARWRAISVDQPAYLVLHSSLPRRTKQ